MGFLSRRQAEKLDDTRTEALINKMDAFLIEMQAVADRLARKLDEKGADK